MSYKRNSPVPVVEGGTGAQTLTIHGVLLGQNTSAVAALSAAATGETLMGNTGADPSFTGSPSFSGSVTAATSITATAGDVIVTAGNITLPYTNTGATEGAILAGGVPLLHDYNVGNVFLGSGAGNTLVTLTGMFNTVLGSVSAQALTTGQDNVIAGSSGLSNLTTGSNNSVLGTGGLNNLVSGSNNISIGQGSAISYTTNEASNIIIGNAGVIADANTIRIGTTGGGVAQQNKAYIAGIDGVNVGSVAKVLTMASDQVGTATITAGLGISVTPGANTITISSVGSGFTWTVTTVDAPLVAENGYIANKAGLLTMTLPASGSIGDAIAITGINTAVGWRIAQNANQQIHFGAASTSVGVLGYIESTAIRDSVEMICVVAGASTEWQVINNVGNITVA